MDLKQRKLNKTEWNNTEVPVSQEEKRILKLICEGYHDVNIKMNLNQSLSSVIKLDATDEMEAYLYERYFNKEVKKMIKKYGNESMLESEPGTKELKKLRKTDMMKIDNMDNTISDKKEMIFEYVLLDMIYMILKYLKKKNDKYSLAMYTLVHLMGSTISNTNKYILKLANNVIGYANENTSILETISRAYEYIEKNPVLLKYEDLSLFEHQKRIYNTFNSKM